MLTDRGWALAGAGAALFVLWVMLGEIELAAGGGLLLGAVLAALLLVASRPRVSVTRRLNPNLVNEGERITVDTTIENQHRRTLRNGVLVDEVETLGRAEFDIGTLRGGESAQAAYQIVCRPRGVYRVGPVRVRVSDPLGLAKVEAVGDRVDRLIVYPEAEDLAGFPATRGRDPSDNAVRPEFAHRGGEDFFTLREYRHGDDLRLVHWPSSAKRDELMLRQLETPWQSRALVLLDLRAGAYENPACFEKAVRGAASVVRHFHRHGLDAELWAGSRATISLDTLVEPMETLARIRPDPRLDLAAAAGRIRLVGRGGALILISGVADHELLEVQRRLGREHRTTVVMLAAATNATGEAALHRAGAATMTVAPDESWADAWGQTLDRQWRGVSAR